MDLNRHNEFTEYTLTEEEQFNALKVSPETNAWLRTLRTAVAQRIVYIPADKPPEEIAKIHTYYRAQLDILNTIIESLPPLH